MIMIMIMIMIITIIILIITHMILFLPHGLGRALLKKAD